MRRCTEMRGYRHDSGAYDADWRKEMKRLNPTMKMLIWCLVASLVFWGALIYLSLGS